jgi:HSP20 family protein
MVKKLTLGDYKETKDEEINEKDLFNSPGELVVDVFETDAEFVVSAPIAGVQIKDLDISVEKGMMVIKGDRSNPHTHPEKKYFYQECYFGPFARKIVLPENINTEEAEAQMDKGMLTVKIPKVTEDGATKKDIQES